MSFIYSIFIGVIGTAYVVYGKKSYQYYYLTSGIIQWIYPYFIHNVILLLLIEIILLVGPYLIYKYY